LQPFVTHTGRAVSLRRACVDTDQIIPAEYLKRVTRSGFGDGLFAAWRADPGFVLNQPQAAGATVLLAGPGLLPVRLPEQTVTALADVAEADPQTLVTVDLAEREVRAAQASGDVLVSAPIDIDDYTRWRLMEGLDDVSLTLRHAEDIARYEQGRPDWLPVAG